MSIFKCKMCGGSLEIAEGTTVCECEYCGTQQTLPKNHDNVLTNLFNRANNLRMKSEFDKAQEIYEKIVGSNTNEAEAYWGIVLCKYGIEYVEDPATFKKIPTCHRTQLESVMTDVDYQSALEYADTIQRGVYESEAAAIDRLQKDILAIVHNEQPFDVFICYKETDESGKRTQDSVIANDIYHQLTQEGFKVFYAAITLEDKLGQEYEPYIFAALNSAKVMLALGTKPEYFSAVWVKNEWSRYIKLMKSDRSKLLIPCYKDMDAYDLPEEFSHLQAQDMGKIGFINDVIRGIKKVIVRDEPKQTVVRETVVQAASVNTAPLLKRIELFLEKKDWASATEYCNRVLDQDPECAMAYFYMLLAELKLSSEKALEAAAYENGIADSTNYEIALRFADSELKQKLEDLHKGTIYNFAVASLDKAANRNDCMKAKQIFERLSGYKDSAKKAAECDDKANDIDYQAALYDMVHAGGEQGYKTTALKFDNLGDYKDSKEKAAECRQKAKDSAKDAIYNEAKKLYNSQDDDLSASIDKVRSAKTKFEEISGWRDSDDMAGMCADKIQEIQELIEEEERLTTRKARKSKITAIVAVIAVCLISGGFVLTTQVIIPNAKYNSAVNNLKNKDFDKAISTFESLNGYKDSAEKIKETKYRKAQFFAESDKYNEAIAIYNELNDYSDSKDRMAELKKEKRYIEALELMNNGEYDKAYSKFSYLSDYKDSSEKIIEINNILIEEKYNTAIKELENGNYDEAITIFDELGDYKESKDKKDKAYDSWYSSANSLMKAEKYDEAITEYTALGNYKDSAKKANKAKEQNVVSIAKSSGFSSALSYYISMECSTSFVKLMEDNGLASKLKVYKEDFAKYAGKYKSSNANRGNYIISTNTNNFTFHVDKLYSGGSKSDEGDYTYSFKIGNSSYSMPNYNNLEIHIDVAKGVFRDNIGAYYKE